MTDEQPDDNGIWWGSYSPRPGECFERDIGPLRLTVERDAREWRVTSSRTDPGTPDGEPTTDRYVVGETQGPLRLVPVVADRPVVTEPLSPLHLVPGSRVTLYVSTPLWYRLEVGEPPVHLQDRHVIRPSDTWFGPSTREGELCYASRTAGRLELEDVPRRPERAVTAVTIRNDTKSVLPLQRLSLPAPQLAVYADAEGMLWTQDVTLDNREEADLANLRLDSNPPAGARAATFLSAPRQAGKQQRLVRAFGAIFR